MNKKTGKPSQSSEILTLPSKRNEVAMERKMKIEKYENILKIKAEKEALKKVKEEALEEKRKQKELKLKVKQEKAEEAKIKKEIREQKKKEREEAKIVKNQKKEELKRKGAFKKEKCPIKKFKSISECLDYSELKIDTQKIDLTKNLFSQTEE